jgi:hypothetical protein
MADHSAPLRFILLLLLVFTCFGSDLDIQCLKSVQKSVVDPSGVLNSTWNFANGTDGFICKFTGVECWHPDENRVLSLRLGNLGLQGSFPRGLQNCTSMTGLDLSSNSFTGPIPPDISREMPYLTSLDLSYNSFSGLLPQNISNMTYLNLLNLQHNQFSGPIPQQFNLLTRLTTFNVADNQLSGPIPYSLRNLSASNFAGNPGLCGTPLDQCQASSKSKNTAAIIGAIVGVVVVIIIVVIIVFVCLRKLPAKKAKDEEDNKWAKSIKGTKTIKVICCYLFFLLAQKATSNSFLSEKF